MIWLSEQLNFPRTLSKDEGISCSSYETHRSRFFNRNVAFVCYWEEMVNALYTLHLNLKRPTSTLEFLHEEHHMPLSEAGCVGVCVVSLPVSGDGGNS